MKHNIFILILLLATAIISGCESKTNQAPINSLEDLKDRTLIIGTADDIDAKSNIFEICPNAQIVSQNDILYGIRSVSERKIDAYIVGRKYLEEAINETQINNVKILDEPIISYKCALGLSTLCTIPDFEKTVNDTMSRLISDGITDEMRDRWFNKGIEQLPEIDFDDNPTYTIHAVTFGQNKPYSFISDGKLSGFDVELLYRICAENHWGLILDHADYPGMLMGLSTGKFDIVSANLYVTENREENVIFSIPYTTEDISIAVYDDSLSDDSQLLEFNSMDELKKADTFGVITGTIHNIIISQYFPDAKIKYYPTSVDCAIALSNDDVDAVVYDEPTIRYLASCTPGLEVMPEYFMKDDYYFILAKNEKSEKLRDEFNEWLNEKRKSGKLKELKDFWCGSEEPGEIFDFESLPATNGTISIAVVSGSRPDTFYYKNSISGYPCELIYDFCSENSYGAKVSVISFEGIITYLVTGKADMIVELVSYTEERAENVLYTDCVMEGSVGVLVRTTQASEKNSFIDIIANGLKKTFIAESRWKLILSGLLVTLLITFGGFVLANILGVTFCACSMSDKKFLRVFADVYDRIIQGTPIVVILMILYYVIFGKSHISGITVAIIGFGLTSGASLARQFYVSVSEIDKGQTEAALSIGFTKFETFTGIVLPQAARIALPGYFSEIINLMKGTAIVGYIAVTDLTKASDLIRSSTYDAFFPLLSVALIYFLIAFVILNILKYIQKKLAPKRIKTQEKEK